METVVVTCCMAGSSSFMMGPRKKNIFVTGETHLNQTGVRSRREMPKGWGIFILGLKVSSIKSDPNES